MTGPEHYQRAEQLEALAAQLANQRAVGHPVGDPVLAAARAQVHATLALAAASAGVRREWQDVLYPDRDSTPRVRNLGGSTS